MQQIVLNNSIKPERKDNKNTVLNLDGEITNMPAEVCNAFNHHFVNAGRVINVKSARIKYIIK